MSDLVVKNNAIDQYVPDDFGGIPMRTMTLPRCELGQGTSQNKKNEPGKFFFPDNDWKAQDKLENVSVIVPKLKRVLFGKGFKSASRCGSDNSHTPAARYANPVSKSCADCPLSKWPNEIFSAEDLALRQRFIEELEVPPKKRGQPLCKETLWVVMFDKRLVPFSMKFQSIALTNVYRDLINVLRFSGRRIFASAFDILISKASGPEGEPFYVHNFTNFREAEDLETNQMMHGKWAPIVDQIIDSQNARADEEKSVQPLEDAPF